MHLHSVIVSFLLLLASPLYRCFTVHSWFSGPAKTSCRK